MQEIIAFEYLTVFSELISLELSAHKMEPSGTLTKNIAQSLAATAFIWPDSVAATLIA